MNFSLNKLIKLSSFSLMAPLTALACNWPVNLNAKSSERSMLLEVCRLANVERRRYKAPPLELDFRLMLAAQGHSEDMAARKYFDHQSPEGESMAGRLKRAQAQYMTAGENIARGQQTAAQVMSAWMKSPGHRKNLINPKYRQLGLGLLNYYWTQNFTD